MKNIVTSGKRKSAVARAVIEKGNGTITINKIPIDQWSPSLNRGRIREPLILAGDLVEGVNIDVHVAGGGITSQADASRLAIAKALVTFTKSDKLKDRYLKYDRQLLVADVRRKEPAKPNRHGQARAKRQKSYR